MISTIRNFNSQILFDWLIIHIYPFLCKLLSRLITASSAAHVEVLLHALEAEKNRITFITGWLYKTL